jgi:lipopolysaccharide/colanic/teichoic acid biosynthesis glycosyltransferase
MAIIGPRPERPIFVNEIAEVMPLRNQTCFKPGINWLKQIIPTEIQLIVS